MYRDLLEALEHAGRPTIGVIGDLMLDRYLWGEVDRISPEAPVPIVHVDRSKTNTAVGGAGSVMRDLKALGADVWAAGVVGDDEPGRAILAGLDADEVDTAAVMRDATRATTVKTRLLSRTQHMMRIDEQESRPLDGELTQALVNAVGERLADTDILIFSDYVPTGGVLSRRFIRSILDGAAAHGVPVWADPAKGRDFADFKGVTAVTPNRRETSEATGLSIPAGTIPEEAAARLVEWLELDVAVITLDVEGIYYRTREGAGDLVPAVTRGAYDVTGAGDMVIAAATFAVAAGMPLGRAVALANFAAGMEVERIGVQPIERREIIRRLRSKAHLASEKVLPLDELKVLLENHRRRGERVVFTNGCFDIIHPGHVRFLEFARDQGDVLVVGLNSDSSVAAIKGPSRPVFTEGERATVLAALESVDYVTIFSDETPLSLINAVRPDILVKGEDWRDKGVVGREVVESAGGKVVLAPLVPGVSTSGAIERVLDRRSGGKKR